MQCGSDFSKAKPGGSPHVLTEGSAEAQAGIRLSEFIACWANHFRALWQSEF